MLIAIHGSYYDNNFGDLLLLKIYENWIRSVVNASIVYPMVPKKEVNRFQKYFPNASTGLHKFKSWKALIYAGGGHFGEPDSTARNVYSSSWNKRFFKRHVLPAELCIWSGIPYAITGVGVGPLTNFLVRHETKRIFANAQFLSVRDVDSKKFAQNVLNIQSDIPVTPDAALSLNRSDIPQKVMETVNQYIRPFKGKILLGIHHPRDFLSNTSQAKSMKAGLLTSLASIPNIVPVIFTDNGNSDKSQTCNKLSKEIENSTGKKCLSLPFQGVWETVGLISQLSAVLSSKLHVNIVAYSLGVYSESFAIHSKVRRFYHQINRPSQCIMLKDTNKDITMQKVDRAVQKALCEKSAVIDTDWKRYKEQALLGKNNISSWIKSIV